jgi:hypothetical protein
MTEHPDGRGGLADEPFSYRRSKDGRVFISWRGQRAMILAGRKADSFMARMSGLDPLARQQAMARVTGNFKRGNERSK